LCNVIVGYAICSVGGTNVEFIQIDEPVS
jgi:hypothetical protein